MGYSRDYFTTWVKDWIDRGWLAPGHRLIDFGAQEFDGPASVAEMYATLGINYASIDVDGARGSTFFDLNTFAVPHEWMGAFDFVNDEGTVEHLVNPINCFHVAHDMAKIGGVIRHSFPLIGWREHGFFYPTTKLCAQLVGDNGYELLEAIASHTGQTPFADAFFKLDRATPAVTDLWAFLTYRKTSNRPFVIPVDHVGGPSAARTKVVLRENYDRMTNHRDPGDRSNRGS